MMYLSYFSSMTSKQPRTATLEQVAHLIREDETVRNLTASYRRTRDKVFKSRSPLFAVACRFEGGKSLHNIKALTGLSLVDFDHITDDGPKAENGNTAPAERLLELKRKIIADPHTLMCYTTISGHGLRVIFKYETPVGTIQNSLQSAHMATFYQQAFLAGNAYYEQLIGVTADRQCKNVNRLSGIAHDPDVFLRPEAEAAAFTLGEIESMAGRQSRLDKESKQWKRIQTYYDAVIAPRLAKDGIEYKSGSHNAYVMRVGYMLAERRYAKAVSVKWAKETFADYADTEQVIVSCFANAPKKGHRSAGTAAVSVEGIKEFLDGRIRMRYNVVTCRVEHEADGVWTPLNDRMVNTLWAELSLRGKVFKQDVYNIIESDYVKDFHPFRDYLESLKPWHPGDHDYIADLADTVKVKGRKDSGIVFRDVLLKWMVGMVAAWTDDDVVNNVILVLIGEQGSYKTTWFNRLLPPQLQRYFYTKTNARRMSKDDLLTLAQYGLVCCEELDTMQPAELSQLKAAVTMPSIDERAAYAHFHEHRMHIASFCGTGNNAQFLSDPTGNRRWLPFEVERILSPRERPFAHDGIYAQAYALYKSGFKFWFEKEEIKKLNEHNKAFETPRLERELVDLYFRKPGPAETGIFMSAARALQIISAGISQKLTVTNVSKAFAELGFKKVHTNKCNGYIVVCRTGEEMKAYQAALLHDTLPEEE